MTVQPWYKRYSELRSQVAALKLEFETRCTNFGAEPEIVMAEVQRDLIARAVHESNWQEGLQLDEPRTTELTNEAFDELKEIQGPHLDIASISRFHRKRVVEKKKLGISVEELAAYNLSNAYIILGFISNELMHRQTVGYVHIIQRLIQRTSDDGWEEVVNVIRDKKIDLNQFSEGLLEWRASTDPLYMPLTEDIGTHGELVKQLMLLDGTDLLEPMRIDYIHLLHRLTMTGIIPTKACGSFRTVPVHVGEPNLLFPTPSLITGMMNEYCRTFPPFYPTIETQDVILEAARASYQFVRIHPYTDGNGRISRLLMNLVLWWGYPIVHLKADKDGRKRYIYALRRANRGNIEPLACLIALSLIETFQQLLAAVRPVRIT